MPPFAPCSATAWDTVEELSAAASHAKEQAKSSDPLEKYCEGAPDADECRVYGELGIEFRPIREKQRGRFASSCVGLRAGCLLLWVFAWHLLAVVPAVG